VDINWTGLADVLFVGLFAGVMLTGMFAVGVRLLAAQPGAQQSAGARTAGAWLCFALCAAGAAYGLVLLIRR
jgi:hypothetical protein